MASKKRKSRLGAKSIQELSALLMKERKKPHAPDTLRDIDEAMQRILDGTYGICLGTGKPIKKRRLMAIPWAKYSIEYAKLMEQGLERQGPSNEYLDGPYAA